MKYENSIDKMLNSLTLLLGMGTSMLFEMEKQMTPDQIRFFQWWLDSMYSVIYDGKPISFSSIPNKTRTDG